MAMLTVSEIRKLIKAHNVLTKITIPKGATRNDLIKLVEKKGYTVDHEGKKISRKVDGKPETITLKGAEIIGKPKEKTALQKQKAAEKKEEKAMAQKKKERELKKEAVKKATKDMVPKTQPPKKIGAKPVPQKKPSKKEDEVRPISKPGRPRVDPSKITVIQPKKKEEPKKKKEKKKYATEGAKKIGEAIKAKKAAKEKAKEEPLFKEKIETPEETFFRNLKYIITMFNILPGEVGYVDKDKRIKSATIKVLGSIIDKKKTSKFTKPETKKLEEALKFYKRKNSQDKKGIEIFESFVSDTGSEKIRKGTVRERKSLATLKEKWSTGAKLTFKWSPEQVKQIEDILNNRDGIEAQGYEQKDSGFKWVFYFTKNGKQEKLIVERPDPRPFKEIKELKAKEEPKN